MTSYGGPGYDTPGDAGKPLPKGYVDWRAGSAVPGVPGPEAPDTTAVVEVEEKPRGTGRNILEWVLVIGGALVLALVIRSFLLAAFYIPSESMVDTLNIGDRVLVNKVSYRLHDVRRGDIIVFERPPNEPDNGIKDLIKRVIALPGETVEGRDCRISIKRVGEADARLLDEPYTDGKCTSTFAPVTVPAGHVWVMGDNRPESQDSRYFGAIDQDLIVGRAFVRVWPLSHLGWL